MIGDEILSGRTKDANINHLAQQLEQNAIQLREVRIVPDAARTIINAVNELRARYTHVFTSGGIGPTHDDITAAAIADAFGVDLREDERAVRILRDFYPDGALTEARLRMARIPAGAGLIENSVSAAPGFSLGNVHVMAGVPDIMQAMLAAVLAGLEKGIQLRSLAIDAPLGESRISAVLAAIQAGEPMIRIGSYPRVVEGNYATQIVLRGHDARALGRAGQKVRDAIAAALKQS